MTPETKDHLRNIAKHFYKKKTPKRKNGTISDEELQRLRELIKTLPKKTFIPCQ